MPRWDDLISIIDVKTEDDVEAWSNVWVKTPGMPEYDWSNGIIKQSTDSVSNRIWQQPLKIQRSDQSDTTVSFISEVAISVPGNSDFNFLNPDGFSYGYFKMDNKTKDVFLAHPMKMKDPVFRASMWMNCWESLVRGDGPSVEAFIRFSLNALEVEDNPLMIDFLLGNLQSAWWIFLPEHNRNLLQGEAENVLWKLVQSTTDSGMKNSFFRAYRNIANTEKSLLLLEDIWNEKVTIKDIALSEEDKIALAYELALKMPQKQQIILSRQLNAIKNPDRKERMQFVMPALSNDPLVRAQFFESLKLEKNREHEPWVLEAISYLHHPLRAESSKAFLKPSLELLQEIQLTGDIFFPQRWLHHTLEGHTSRQALEIVDGFLKKHPDYPPYLRDKILQASDGLKRAVMLQDVDPSNQ